MNIHNEIARLTKQITAVENYLSDKPRQKIHIRRHGKYHYIYLKEEGTPNGTASREKYVSAKSLSIAALVNTKYCRLLLPALNSELKALQNFRKNYKPEEKYRALEKIPRRFRPMLVSPLKSPDKICREWAEESFSKNPFPFTEGQSFVTKRGEQVRSKAEYIIADILTDMGLFYRYEAEYQLGSRVTYPDFTIMHPHSCELYYLEYFGMMDSEEYSAASLRKIGAYQQSGDAARFIYVFESRFSPMNIQSIRNLLRVTFFSDDPGCCI